MPSIRPREEARGRVPPGPILEITQRSECVRCIMCVDTHAHVVTHMSRSCVDTHAHTTPAPITLVHRSRTRATGESRLAGSIDEAEERVSE